MCRREPADIVNPGVGLPFRTSNHQPTFEALVPKADPGSRTGRRAAASMPAASGSRAEAAGSGSDRARLEARPARARFTDLEALRGAVALHRAPGTAEPTPKLAAPGPNPIHRLTEVVAKES